MRHSRTGNSYFVIRFPGNDNHFYGLTFTSKNVRPEEIQVIRIPAPELESSPYRKVLTSKEEVLKQTLAGLNEFNRTRGTTYKLSQIYYVPYDNPGVNTYKMLSFGLVKNYHYGTEFTEVDYPFVVPENR